MIFNNPERHNAISLEMWEAALEIMADFGADPAVRVMVLTGAGGKAFVVGRRHLEVQGRAPARPRRSRTTRRRRRRPTRRCRRCAIPTIAMIRGYCIGGGTAVAVCCDLRICTENAKFGDSRGQARPRLRPEPRAAARRPGRARRSRRRCSSPAASSTRARPSGWVSSTAWSPTTSSRPTSRRCAGRSPRTRRSPCAAPSSSSARR